MRGPTSRIAALAVAGTALWGGSAEAKTYEVTRTGDPTPGTCRPSDCSLREAVLAANASLGVADRILLPNRRRPYRLTQTGTGEDGAADGDLDVTNNRVTIVHPRRGRATIDAGDAGERAFDAFAPLSLKKVILTGGVDITGGAIHAAADLRVLRSVLRGNRTSSATGGAIKMDGQPDAPADLRVVRSLFRGNESASTGGAIRDGETGTITIIRSRFIRNEASSDGGAIRFSNTGGTIVRSTFRGNRADSDGGAIQTDLENPLALRKTTIHGNLATGDGGGIFARGSGFRIVASTISANRAEGPDGDGGGMFLDGATAVSVTNGTIEGNRASSAGGGIAVVSTSQASLNAVTVVRNVADFDNNEGIAAIGGGLFGDDPDSFTVRNSIIALNRDGPVVGNDCSEPDAVESLGNNLISTDLGCSGFDGPNDRVRSNPKLANLKRNGGPTKTVALKKGSPAIGKAHRPSAPDRDQRGRKRDRRPDIGAFERGA